MFTFGIASLLLYWPRTWLSRIGCMDMWLNGHVGANGVNRMSYHHCITAGHMLVCKTHKTGGHALVYAKLCWCSAQLYMLGSPDPVMNSCAAIFGHARHMPGADYSIGTCQHASLLHQMHTCHTDWMLQLASWQAIVANISWSQARIDTHLAGLRPPLSWGHELAQQQHNASCRHVCMPGNCLRGDVDVRFVLTCMAVPIPHQPPPC